jgi:hypothetical protein
MSNFVIRSKKAAIGALALAVISTGFTAVSSTSADAQWRPRTAPGYAYRGKRGNGNRGAAVAAGVIGALAVGALVAGASRPAYAQPSYGYAQPGYGYAQPSYGYAQPVYTQGYDYQPAYQPTCYKRKVRQIVDEDTVVIRTIRECR